MKLPVTTFPKMLVTIRDALSAAASDRETLREALVKTSFDEIAAWSLRISPPSVDARHICARYPTGGV